MKKKLLLLLLFLFLVSLSESQNVEASRCFEDPNQVRDSLHPCEGGGSGGRPYSRPAPVECFWREDWVQP